ncbi:DnaD domain-containing protein [Vagococcus sp. JNUCC 83]
MSKGAFQTSREIFENPIWSDVVKFRIFFYIYGNAVFAKEGVTIAGIHLKRGQYLRSYRNLKEDLAYVEKRAIKYYSLHTIKNKIDKLVEENRLKIETTDYGTLFTVVNYEEYQGFERYANPITEQQRNSNGTPTEQQRNNNKNVKKDKNDNKIDVDRPNIVQAYEYVFGMSNSFIIESLNHWCNDLSEELVIEALKQSAAANANSFKYTEAIMKSWEKSNVKTLSDVAALTKKREVQKPKYNNYNKPTRKETVPEVFTEKRKETPVSAEEQAELEAQIRQFTGEVYKGE